MREKAYLKQIKLARVLKVAQFTELSNEEQRNCVDCIGHRWVPGQRKGTWRAIRCSAQSLASGTSIDAECGFVQCTPKQLHQLATNIVRKVSEIEARVSCYGHATIACSHGSNRSFLIANLYYQKQHSLGYEEVRQLMTTHRGVKDGPLYHPTSQSEPSEFLRKEFAHDSRPAVPVTTRFNHENRWQPIGLEYGAYEDADLGDSDSDSSSDDGGYASDSSAVLAAESLRPEIVLPTVLPVSPRAAPEPAAPEAPTPAPAPESGLCVCDGCWQPPALQVPVGGWAAPRPCVAAQRRAMVAARGVHTAPPAPPPAPAPVLAAAPTATVAPAHALVRAPARAPAPAHALVPAPAPAPALVPVPPQRNKHNPNYVKKGRFGRRGRYRARGGGGGARGGRAAARGGRPPSTAQQAPPAARSWEELEQQEADLQANKDPEGGKVPHLPRLPRLHAQQSSDVNGKTLPPCRPLRSRPTPRARRRRSPLCACAFVGSCPAVKRPCAGSCTHWPALLAKKKKAMTRGSFPCPSGYVNSNTGPSLGSTKHTSDSTNT